MKLVATKEYPNSPHPAGTYSVKVGSMWLENGNCRAWLRRRAEELAAKWKQANPSDFARLVANTGVTETPAPMEEAKRRSFKNEKWEVLPEEDDKDYLRIRGTVIGHTYKIANVPFFPGYEQSRLEAHDFARLIAAAPRLLLALESIIEMNPELPMGMMEEARAAFTEATGYQP